MNGFAALDIHPHRRYVIDIGGRRSCRCRLYINFALFLHSLNFTQNLGLTRKRCHMDLPGSTNLIQRKASRTSRLQPLHAKFLLCHDGFIRWVVDLLAVDRIFYRHGSTFLIYKESFSFFSRFFQILSVLCRTDTILFLEYPAKIEWVIIPYDLCNFSNIVFGVLQ